ncbi:MULTISPECIES: type I-E CRISPR-associated protein Cas5/CasD [unclassified Brevibacterium]|uniref:type I-E CRISPR-associated protein Cas5/CasD n=1 Tax=unclassified Brevibacterium TaxID=2614124 RepID=UPI0008A4CFC9|nr:MULTISPECIES: type I-E CRISPR-associated protein Cas5/CasD [unclassified Brevibacterium]OFS27837.1 hypothetical protein HMPREF3162_01095 [Brevibacterium sp. HMSC07C04]
MKTMVLNLSGPMQSWGVSSRFSRRSTETEPSKSGVIGLLAAAQGRSRTAEVDDLAELVMAVRVDRPGQLLEDFHTARRPGAKHSVLSYRHYRADAAYTAAVAGEDALIDALSHAVVQPEFPLYLGRRSCPAPPNLFGGVFNGVAPEDVLRDLDAAPWQAAEDYRKSLGRTVFLPLARDAQPGEIGEAAYDVPVSFNPEHRQYRVRLVVRPDPVRVENDLGAENTDRYLNLAQEA